MPADVYDKPHYYTGYSGAELRETMAQLRKARGNPDAEITIYRGVPKGVNQINDGDWVSLSKNYAINHSQMFDDSTILSKKVRAAEVRWALDDLMEFGYFPSGVNDPVEI
jgi:hypothetical protein